MRSSLRDLVTSDGGKAVSYAATFSGVTAPVIFAVEVLVLASSS